MFKLLTILGSLQKENKESTIGWVEETRSTLIQAQEKTQLLKVIGDTRKGAWEDKNLMAIGIEMRLNTGCERHVFPQLKSDCK